METGPPDIFTSVSKKKKKTYEEKCPQQDSNSVLSGLETDVTQKPTIENVK